MHQPPQLPPPEMSESGAPLDGKPQTSDTRLYMQLLAFTGCLNPTAIVDVLTKNKIEGAVYLDLHDPQGVAVLTMSEDPAFFTDTARAMFCALPFTNLQPRPEFTMFGKTYGIGRDPDLQDSLTARPRRNSLHPDNQWAIWYPLRRKPEFHLLEPREQGKILFEHAQIGMAYGAANLAKDARLVSYGLDKNDNEFIIGLFGRELHPLSRVVQDMRKTQQTARYISSLGPFFVGRVFWQSKR